MYNRYPYQDVSNFGQVGGNYQQAIGQKALYAQPPQQLPSYYIPQPPVYIQQQRQQQPVQQPQQQKFVYQKKQSAHVPLYNSPKKEARRKELVVSGGHNLAGSGGGGGGLPVAVQHNLSGSGGHNLSGSGGHNLSASGGHNSSGSGGHNLSGSGGVQQAAMYNSPRVQVKQQQPPPPMVGGGLGDSQQQYMQKRPSGGRPVTMIHKDEIQELEKLGEGAFGKVYKAIWRGREVAVKKISGHIDSSVMTEIEILWKVRHPNVAEMLGVVEYSSDEISIVTEYYNGKSLYDILHGCKIQLSLSEMIDLATDVAKAMTYLHDFQITHRDIKSQNILLQKDGTVTNAVVCDFGIAKAHKLKHETQIGTPNWMAPEVVVLNAKKGYSSKVDVYSYGMLLYEMMTNQIPFAGMNAIQIGFCLVRGERPLKPKKCDRTPKEFIYLMTRCWAQDPDKRPTFDEIKRELKMIENKYCSGGDNNIISSPKKKFSFWPFKK